MLDRQFSLLYILSHQQRRREIEMNSTTLKTIKATSTTELQAFAAKIRSSEYVSQQQAAMWAAIQRELANR